jgi:flagellin
MGLRINTNVASQTVQKNLREVSSQTDSSLQNLSSGKRINKAADDAAGLAIATNLESQTKSLRQASRNANDGISLIQVAEGGLQESSNILTRLRELSIQAASDTIGDKERGYLDMEFQQLVQEVDRIAESTNFNGMSLLNGEGKGNMDFQVGAFAGEHNQIQFNSGETDASARSLGVRGTGVGAKRDAQSSIQKIDDAIDKVSGQRATLGAIQSRLNSTISNLETQTLNQDAARSVIQDADIALETSKLASNNVLKNAGISTLSQANSNPNVALRLLN